MIVAGLDLGTVAIKAVFINEKNELLWSGVIPSSCDGASMAEKLLGEGKWFLKDSGNDLFGIAATGYGRHSLAYADMLVDEISAIATGGYILSEKKAKIVINIGGQDSKVISISQDGKVCDFRMNDKCAAGTGRFIEMAARILGVPLDKIGDLGHSSCMPVAINSTCAVFAESEIVSLLYKKSDKNDIVAGLNRSIARRIFDFMQGMRIEDEVYFDGGPAKNKGLLVALEEETSCKMKTFTYPQLTGAIGAALVLMNKIRGKTI